MTKQEKIYQSQRAKLYANAEIYKLSEEVINKNIDNLKKSLERQTDSKSKLITTAKLKVYENRLLEIKDAKRRGLYNEFYESKYSKYPKAKTNKALLYLAKVENEYQKSLKPDFLGLRQKSQAKKLARLEKDLNKRYSKSDVRVLSVAFERYDEIYKTTEGKLTAEDQVSYRVLKAHYEAALKAHPVQYISHAEANQMQLHNYIEETNKHEKELAKAFKEQEHQQLINTNKAKEIEQNKIHDFTEDMYNLNHGIQKKSEKNTTKPKVQEKKASSTTQKKKQRRETKTTTEENKTQEIETMQI